jgi:hypothetical protein
MTDPTRMQIWSLLNEAFETVLHTVQALVPGITMETGVSKNEAFLLRAYAQYTGGHQIVVISFDVQVKDREVYLFGDIDLDNGHVIKELLQCSIDAASCNEDVVVSRVKEFAVQCKGNSAFIATELSRVANQ